MANCIILNGGSENPSDRRIFQKTIGSYRIASCLEDEGYTTRVIDHLNEFTMDELIEAITPHLGADTLWVGVSSTFVYQINKRTDIVNVRGGEYGLEMMYFHSYDDMLRLFDLIKQLSPQAKIVYGGARSPFFTMDPKVDYYVFGYADTAVVDLTHYLSGRKDRIEHVTTENTYGDVMATVIDSALYPEPRMDDISTHWWRQDLGVLPGESLPIELARGCIFRCKFCNFHLIGKKKGTYIRDMSEIRDELIRMYETHGTTNYWFTDDTFNDDIDKVEAFHRLFTSLPFKPQFSTYLRLDLINKYPEEATMLKEMGMVGCFFGIETLNKASGTAIGKGLAPSKVKDRLYWLEEQWRGQINVETNFILGLPYDTQEYFFDLIKWCTEPDNPVQSIGFAPLSMYYYHKQKPEWDRYSSDISINPDIYGYRVKEGTTTDWTLPTQNLNYKTCLKIAGDFTKMCVPRNKISGFAMPTMLTMGVPHADLINLTVEEVQKKHDFGAMTRARVQEYKRMIGVTRDQTL
jgi:radical SAM superfamily enzyme YgiQ (UPF0313 family)